MIKNEIRAEIENRTTGLGKILVDLLFGVWSLIGTFLFVWILDRFTGSRDE